MFGVSRRQKNANRNPLLHFEKLVFGATRADFNILGLGETKTKLNKSKTTTAKHKQKSHANQGCLSNTEKLKLSIGKSIYSEM